MFDYYKVVVITPYYNRADYVVKSVDSLINQDYDDYHVIVINDGSTDSTSQVLNRYSSCDRVTIVNQENKGLTKSLSDIISGLNCKYVAIHGSGDVSHPDRLRTQVELLEGGGDYCLCGTSSQNLDPDTNDVIDYQKFPKTILHKNDFLSAPPFTHGTAMFDKRKYDMVGGYDRRFKYSQDWDLWLRLMDVGDAYMLKEIQYTRYALRDGASFQPSKASKQLYFKYLALMFDSGSVGREEYFDNSKKSDEVNSEISSKVKGDLERRVLKLILIDREKEASELRVFCESEYGGLSLYITILYSCLIYLSRIGINPKKFSTLFRRLLDISRRMRRGI
jgi:hypothetical protein